MVSLVLACTLLSAGFASAGQPSLVILVFRHGERTPASTYKNDIYKSEDFFPYGWGQLTNAGKLQQYEQGKWLKSRYAELLGDTLTPTLIQASSTYPPRTQMSLSLMLAGLMPPSGAQIWNKDLAWQPFPWVETGENVDKLLLSTNCARISEATEEIEKSKELEEYNKKHSDLYRYLSEHTGENVRGPADVFDIFGTLTAEKDYGLELPPWTKKVFPDEMAEVSARHFIVNTKTKELRRLTGGRLLKKVIESSKSKIETRKENPKMIAYAGHDSTVANLLRAVGVWDEQVPSYNIMAIFELEAPENSSQEWTIQVLLRNSTKDEPHMLQIPGCSMKCPFKEFVKLTSEVIPQDIESECRAVDSDFKPERPPSGP